MTSLMYALNRVFAILASVFWLAAVAAALWQVWSFVSTGAWHTMTVAMACQSLLGAVPTFSHDSLVVAFAIISNLSLVLVLGLAALAFSALAKLLE